jgi:hypothetical protein
MEKAKATNTEKLLVKSCSGQLLDEWKKKWLPTQKTSS